MGTLTSNSVLCVTFSPTAEDDSQREVLVRLASSVGYSVRNYRELEQFPKLVGLCQLGELVDLLKPISSPGEPLPVVVSVSAYDWQTNSALQCPIHSLTPAAGINYRVETRAGRTFFGVGGMKMFSCETGHNEFLPFDGSPDWSKYAVPNPISGKFKTSGELPAEYGFMWGVLAAVGGVGQNHIRIGGSKELQELVAGCVKDLILEENNLSGEIEKTKNYTLVRSKNIISKLPHLRHGHMYGKPGDSWVTPRPGPVPFLKKKMDSLFRVFPPQLFHTLSRQGLLGLFTGLTEATARWIVAEYAQPPSLRCGMYFRSPYLFEQAKQLCAVLGIRHWSDVTPATAQEHKLMYLRPQNYSLWKLSEDLHFISKDARDFMDALGRIKSYKGAFDRIPVSAEERCSVSRLGDALSPATRSRLAEAPSTWERSFCRQIIADLNGKVWNLPPSMTARLNSTGVDWDQIKTVTPTVVGPAFKLELRGDFGIITNEDLVF